MEERLRNGGDNRWDGRRGSMKERENEGEDDNREEILKDVEE